MRKILSYILTSLVLCGFIACSDDDKQIPSNVSNLRAEAREGAIMLRWDIPLDSGYLYAETKYYDAWTEEHKTINTSVYSDSLLMENLLQKFGDYTFSVQSVSTTGDKGEMSTVIASCLRRPADITMNTTPITIEASKISTNSQHPKAGPVKNLVDGDISTFFQSTWEASSYVPWPHYIQVDLDETISNFIFEYVNRNNTTGKAKVINILVSEDGTNYVSIKIADNNLPKEASAKYVSDEIETNKKIKSIRLQVEDTYDNIADKHFNMAELSIKSFTKEVYDPEAE